MITRLSTIAGSETCTFSLPAHSAPLTYGAVHAAVFALVAWLPRPSMLLCDMIIATMAARCAASLWLMSCKHQSLSFVAAALFVLDLSPGMVLEAADFVKFHHWC